MANNDTTGAQQHVLPVRQSLHETVMRSIGECAYEWNVTTDELVWSENTHEILSLDKDAVINTGRRFNALLQATTETTRNDVILSASQTDEGQGVPYSLQYAISADNLSTGDDSENRADIWVEDTGRWFAAPSGVASIAHGVLRVITERRVNEMHLEHLSRHDTLTGLYNRPHLDACLQQTFETLAKSGGSAAFLVVGLEHFDLINSVYGYDAGDAVINEIAQRLKENLRDRDVIGRFSGAKLGIILPESSDRDMLVAGYRLLNMLRQTVIQTTSGPIAVSISIGGVVIPTHARNVQQAFMAAHQALVESRRGRDASIVSYRRDNKRDAERLKAARMAERIVTALKNGRIHLAWQPVVCARTKQLVFHEALIRLEQEDGSVLQAGDFVSVAQHLGLIRLVDHYALDLALQKLTDDRDARISMNVSNETACDPEWLSKLAHKTRQVPGMAGRLIVEITESHAAESLDEANAFIDAVKDIGCQVALDDFGAGFTSLRNLKKLPFDIIKVDGQFVENLGVSHENQSFIRALVDLAKLFNAKTVVEWVEDDATAAMLMEWGVDYLQGYRFGTPTRELGGKLQDIA